MVDAWFMLDAMDGIREEQLLLAKDFLGIPDYAEQKRRSPRRVLATVLIAAILTLLLAACGYAVYRATMAHRELQPDDENSYFFNGEAGTPNDGIHLELNFGESALALSFDTEEIGTAHGFRWKNAEPTKLRWAQGESLFEFFQIFSDDPTFFVYPSCTKEEALRQSGLTEEEARALSRSGSCNLDENVEFCYLRIHLVDGPQLYKTDQILGWPKGTAEIVREDTWGEYQRLEVIITREMGEDGHEVDKHLFLFHPVEQYLLTFSAPDGAVSFEEMEALAEKLEVVKTGFSYSLEKSEMNWSVADYGAG